MAADSPATIPHPWCNDDVLARVYRMGWNHGHGFACHHVPRLGQKIFSDELGRVTVEAENIREVHQSECYSAESNSRSFSPFEFIAAEFNGQEDSCVTDDLWEAFEAGVSDAISADLAEYTDENYGIEPDDEED